ncbi:unnamed protein product, partial [Meganyctiphanes norvegica]
KYYTFNNKCRINITPYPDYFIYSNHLSESQAASQINRFKCQQVAENLADSNNVEIKKKLRFLCNECGFRCSTKRSLNKHNKKHDLRSIEEIVQSKQIMCDVCGKLLKNKEVLKVHLRIHSDVKYPCTQCDRTYFSKSSLNSHILRHTGKRNLECPHCEKKFFEKCYLNRHIKLVHEATSKEFLCFVCGKGFTTKTGLQEHSRKHSDDRPLICKECGKGFRYRSNLRTHLLAHEGKKPQMCSMCSFGCYTKANLLLHMAKHTETNEQNNLSITEQDNKQSVSEKYIYPD